VLDLSTVVAGPTASMILADLGADIIKVERVGGGEDARKMGPHRGEWGAYFVPLNRGKRSICIDIRKPAGREAVLRIARSCDVFLENFRGGKAAEMGFDEDSLRAANPEIVYASLSAYGPRGPDRSKAGYDAVVQARTGIVSVTGTGEGEPVRTGISVLDMGAGIWTALGVLAALFERERSGKGQKVDASLFQTGIMFMAYHLAYRQFAGVNPQPQGSRHTAFAPYGAFAVSDGSIAIGISGDAMFHRLCRALGHEAWISDARFLTNPDRVRNRGVLEGMMETVLITQPAAHWVALLDEHDVACDRVQNTEQVLADQQLAALGQLAEVALAGETPAAIPRLPIELSRTNPQISGPPPAAGEHTRAILREAGYSDSEIEELIHAGVCGAMRVA
jgi:crotonobetainyl-CoA:carnitine CoA-transferase CaiB-like acyl-CoA transferase